MDIINIRNLSIQFMKYYKYAMYLSLALLLISAISIFFRGFNYGVDFKGGTVLELHFPEEAPIKDVRNKIKEKGFDQFSVQFFGEDSDLLIRLPNLESTDESKLSNKLISELEKDFEFEINRVEFVGAQIGDELRDQGITAALIALFLIMVYIALRFEYRFSIGAILALVHDVVVTLGVFSITQIEFNLSVFAAILAVIGYSLNDTIVVFDRIRENFKSTINSDEENNSIIINQSINQTLSRTLITSFTTLLVLMSLMIFGGEILFGFSFALIIGIIVGTYSSIYIASSALHLLNVSVSDIRLEDRDKERP